LSVEVEFFRHFLHNDARITRRRQHVSRTCGTRAARGDARSHLVRCYKAIIIVVHFGGRSLQEFPKRMIRLNPIQFD
jgi:hypothetical protein